MAIVVSVLLLGAALAAEIGPRLGGVEEARRPAGGISQTPSAAIDLSSSAVVGGMWTRLDVAPSPRWGHSMAYSTRADRIVLFGGYCPTTCAPAQTWVYDLDTNTWENKTTAVHPPAAGGESLVYNPVGDRFVLFYGPLAQTWVYDLNTNTWTNMNPPTAPSPRSGAAMVYASDLSLGHLYDYIILFGGESYPTSFDDTWVYDLGHNAWTDVSRTTRPPGRAGHSMVYDSESNRVILFGGAAWEGSSTVFPTDTWSLTPRFFSWANMNPTTAPAGRKLAPLGYDPYDDHVVMVGGVSVGYLDDTWTYDFNTNTWYRLYPYMTPRGGHAMTFDSHASTIVLFGGVGFEGLYGDTRIWGFTGWEWMANPTWEPSPRGNHAMAYDAESDRVVLFGGGATLSRLGDTWSYDLNLNEWWRRNPSPSPPAGGSAMAYDSRSDRIILFSGMNDPPSTWSYDLNANTWTNMNPSRMPPVRYDFAMAYDSESDRIVLFGGEGPALYFGDTWSYDLETNTWMELTPPVGPSPRSGHGMAYDSESDRIVLFGGNIASGAHYGDDTWSYDFNTNTWTNMTSAVRPALRFDASMDYDSRADRIVLFGGGGMAGYLSDTWSYDLGTNSWSELNPDIAPSGRVYQATVFDSESNRTLLFGGYGPNEYIADTWAFEHPACAPPPPTGLVAAGGLSQTTLGWSAPATDGGSPITSYQVYRGTTSGSLTLLQTLENVLTYTDAAVSNGVTYYYQVSAVNAIGEGSRSNQASARSSGPPPPPATLQATGGDARVELMWPVPASDGGSPITGYNVYSSTVSGNLALLATTAAEIRNYTDAAVLNGVTYYYQVSALNAFGEGPRSAEVTVTPRGPPSAPQEVQTSAGDTRVTLTWSAPASDGGSPVTGYRIYLGRTSANLALVATVGNVLTYTDGNATNGLRWYYQVSALNALGEGPRSGEASAVPVGPPPAPQNPLAVGGDARVTLTWSVPVSDGGSPITNYKVYRGTVSGNLALAATVGAVLTYTDTGLTNGQRYVYQVSATSDLGEGPRSFEVSATPLGKPSSPQGLVATPGNAQVTLTWSAPASDGGSSITNYTVYRGTVPGSLGLLTTLGVVFTYADTAVLNGVTYYYRVTAVSTVGEGIASAEASATPVPPPDSVAPSVHIASPDDGSTLSSASVVVSGTASDNVGVAKVELSLDGTTWVTAAGTTSWSATVTLAEGANTITVRVTDTSGNTAASVIHVSVQTAAGSAGAAGVPAWAWALVAVAIGAAAVAAFLWFRTRGKPAPAPPAQPPAR